MRFSKRKFFRNPANFHYSRITVCTKSIQIAKKSHARQLSEFDCRTGQLYFGEPTVCLHFYSNHPRYTMAKILLQLVVVCAAFWCIDAIRPLLTPNLLPSVLGQFTCGANEMFSHCGNNGCQRSCARLDVTNCIPICSVPGCVCAAGYVRNSNGVCVLPTSCSEYHLFLNTKFEYIR